MTGLCAGEPFSNTRMIQCSLTCTWKRKCCWEPQSFQKVCEKENHHLLLLENKQDNGVWL